MCLFSQIICYHNFTNISTLSQVQICPKCLCIYGFVNKFWTGRIFERLRKLCGGSNLSTDLVQWGIYIKNSMSPVRIRLQSRKEMKSCVARWNPASSEEIFGVPPQMKLNPPLSPALRQISSRSDFIHRRWISSDIGGFSWKKHLRNQVLFPVMCVRFRCKTVCGWFRCTRILQRVH